MFAEFVTSSGRTQSAWAKELQISKSYFSEILSGRRTPSLDLAVRIERATGGVVKAVSWVPVEEVPE